MLRREGRKEAVANQLNNCFSSQREEDHFMFSRETLTILCPINKSLVYLKKNKVLVNLFVCLFIVETEYRYHFLQNVEKQKKNESDKFSEHKNRQ